MENGVKKSGDDLDAVQQVTDPKLRSKRVAFSWYKTLLLPSMNAIARSFSPSQRVCVFKMEINADVLIY